MFCHKLICVILMVNFALPCKISFSHELVWTLDCSSLNLTEIPKEPSVRPVFTLILKHNMIESPSKFSSWLSLRSLDLSHNKIKNLTNILFDGLDNLRYMNLSYNDIYEISYSNFVRLPRLDILDLSGNIIFGSDFPNTSEQLKFPLRNRLKKLFLRTMNITKVPDDIFGHSRYLQVLDLSGNVLKKLPTFPLTLRGLDLSNNSLEKLKAEPFHLSANLRNLSLVDNKYLTEIEKGVFKNIKNLKKLDLTGCTNLSSLPRDITYSLDTIKSFSISGCNFETLPLEFKKFIMKIEDYKLDGNPWMCNASIKWFALLNIPEASKKIFRCSKPRNETVVKYFEPKIEHHIIRYLLISVTLTGFCCLAMSLLMGVRIEKKRRANLHPYALLEGPPRDYPRPIYITTVV